MSLDHTHLPVDNIAVTPRSAVMKILRSRKLDRTDNGEQRTAHSDLVDATRKQKSTLATMEASS
jgi:hypothetical protein